MGGKIPHSLIEEIRLNSDIVTVIGSYFNLRGGGSSFKALCPFHKEKTPSFIVNPQRQIFHCFGCGAGGDVFRFIMDYEKVDFMTAVSILARRAGIQLTLENNGGPGKPGKDILYEIHEQVAQLYHQILLKNAEAEIARQYLKTRNCPKSTVEEFLIGFAPDRWDTVLKWAGKKYKREQLLAAGLITSSAGSFDSSDPSSRTPDQGQPHYYDRFRNRLMFPVHDEQGRVIGFSGRILDKGEKTAKYVNTPETALFHKGRVLYALHRARRAIVQAREAIICEGQFDVIRCHTAGFETAVAAQGTAFTEDHARILKRYADSVALVLDADRAGEDAALRAAETFLRAGLAIRIASLPQGEDPDSLISRKNGVHVFQELLQKAKSALDFQIDVFSTREPLNSEAGLLRCTAAVLEMIRRTPSAVQQSLLLKQAAARLALPEDALRKEFEKLVIRSRSPAVQPESTSESGPSQPITEVALAEHLIADPSLSCLVRDYLPLPLVTDDVCRQVVQASMEAAETDRDIVSILSERDTEERELSRFAAQALAAPAKVKGNLTTNEESVKSLILGIRTSALKRRRAEIQTRLQRGTFTEAGPGLSPAEKLSPAETKNLVDEDTQLAHDINNLKNWENALPLMEFM